MANLKMKSFVLAVLMGLSMNTLPLSQEARRKAQSAKKVSSSNSAVIQQLTTKIQGLVRDMLLGSGDPRVFAGKIEGVLSHALDTMTMSEADKSLVLSVRDTMHRCSRSTYLLIGWVELQNNLFRSILPKNLIHDIDTKFNTETFKERFEETSMASTALQLTSYIVPKFW